MLILTRRVGEVIRIGNDIIIKHLGHRGNAARIGILAPDSLSVDREEIYAKKQKAPDETPPIQVESESHISVEKKPAKKTSKKKEQ